MGGDDAEDLQKLKINKILHCERRFSFTWLNEDEEDAAVVAAAEDQIWVSLLNV